MAKTLEKFFNGPEDPHAIILLDERDLRAIDAIERKYHGWGWKQDPAKAFEALCEHETKAAVRVVMESGMIEVVVAALERFKEWAKAARQLKKAPLGIWMEDEPAAQETPAQEEEKDPKE